MQFDTTSTRLPASSAGVTSRVSPERPSSAHLAAASSFSRATHFFFASFSAARFSIDSASAAELGYLALPSAAAAFSFSSSSSASVAAVVSFATCDHLL